MKCKEEQVKVSLDSSHRTLWRAHFLGHDKQRRPQRSFTFITSAVKSGSLQNMHFFFLPRQALLRKVNDAQD